MASSSRFVAEFVGFPQEEVTTPKEKQWTLFVDGSSCQIDGGIGVYLAGPEGQEHHCTTTLTFKDKNNKAKYEALMAGLGIAVETRVTKVETKADSQVVVNQVLGLYSTKGEKLKKYLSKVWELRDLFSYFNIA